MIHLFKYKILTREGNLVDSKIGRVNDTKLNNRFKVELTLLKKLRKDNPNHIIHIEEHERLVSQKKVKKFINNLLNKYIKT